jgi:hypothetical protein
VQRLPRCRVADIVTDDVGCPAHIIHPRRSLGRPSCYPKPCRGLACGVPWPSVAASSSVCGTSGVAAVRCRSGECAQSAPRRLEITGLQILSGGPCQTGPGLVRQDGHGRVASHPRCLDGLPVACPLGAAGEIVRALGWEPWPTSTPARRPSPGLTITCWMGRIISLPTGR